MLAVESNSTAVDNARHIRAQISMYGCTEAELRSSVELSTTFKYSGAAMVAASMMSDAQEEIAYGMSEAARKTLNRAKWVLFEYCDKQD